MKERERFVKALQFMEWFGKHLAEDPKFKRLVLFSGPWSDGSAEIALERHPTTGRVLLQFRGDEDLGYSPPVGADHQIRSLGDMPTQWISEFIELVQLIKMAYELGKPLEVRPPEATTDTGEPNRPRGGIFYLRGRMPR